ncbi:cytochrome c biogenesis protein ResB [Mangrovibacterium diazotrophicum]|uniref:cytochrome c biogenesis protein ResB n=1 Tax=Mangrovibacterium diazotrophicum TaxID=1261403 RepID=UPI000E73BB2F|nr:cytochrome c biogenesis protein ResB [Mangrovibacterium diazotrophicum]
MQNTKEKKSLWVLPWKYPESFLIAFALFLASLGIEFITGTTAPKISWPANFVSIALLANLSLLLYLLSKKRAVFKWFYSVPASIAGITSFVVPSLLLALIPQKPSDSLFFLYDVTSSWTYTIGVVFFLIILGTVTIKRITKLSKRNIGFFLNHFGLWLCIASAHLGAGDIQKLNMYLEEGKTTWYGIENGNRTEELNFAIKLRDFSIEEYPAKIAFVENSTGEIINQNNKPLMIDPHEGLQFNYKDFDLKIDKLLMSSAPVMNRFEPVLGMGATQSLKILKSNNEAIDTIWISSPSILYRQEMYQIDSSTIMLMTKPEAKRFLSEITVYEKAGAVYDTIIEVNKPIKIAGWKIYQTSYDETMGRWSTKSILELVKDPWLPSVYLGFFLLIAGTFYLIWTGKRKEDV